MSNTNAQSPFTFKASTADGEQIRRNAKLCGRTLSDFLRRRALEVPDVQMVYQISHIRKLMKQMIAEIGRVGNNMNQIAWKLNCNEVLTPLDRQLHGEGVDALKEMRGVLVAQLLKPQGPC